MALVNGYEFFVSDSTRTLRTIWQVLYREKAVLDLWPWRAKTGVAFPTAPVAMYSALESRLRDLAASSVRAFDPRV